MTRSRFLTTALAGGILTIALAACGSGGDDGGTAAPAGGGADSTAAPGPAAGATGDQVEVKGFTYKPENLTVKAGTKVTWTFKDDADHNVEPVGGAEPTKSPDLKDGGTYSFTFTKPGTVKYRCSIHNYMTGTVTVTA